jgi:hypothetical protein
MIEKTPNEAFARTFQRIRSPLLETESPQKANDSPPSLLIKGTERATKNKKGRTMSTFFSICPKGNRATRVIVTSPTANRAKRENEEGGELTPTKMKVKKTMIFALASRRWIGLSIRL